MRQETRKVAFPHSTVPRNLSSTDKAQVPGMLRFWLEGLYMGDSLWVYREEAAGYELSQADLVHQ